MKAISASLILAVVPLAASTGPRPPIAPCADAYKPFVSQGCYEDAASRALIYRSAADQNSMTIDKCTDECKSNGFRYAGLKYYGVCYCGSSLDSLTVDTSECQQPCSGDPNEICGGDNALSVYEDPTFPKKSAEASTDDYKPLGCYNDDVEVGRALFKQVDVPAEGFTTNLCLDACRKEGFSYAGTEFGRECWCGTNISSDNVLVDASHCDVPCAGDSSMSCGGHDHLNLYYAKDLDSSEPCGYKPPTTTTAPPPATTTATAPTCTSTVVNPPQCEYKAGHWCGPLLPDWTDKTGCLITGKTCALQLSSCFKTAGWPGVQKCFEFGAWCLQIQLFCIGGDCAGSRSSKCNKKACWNKYKPAGIQVPTTTTITTACPTSLISSTTAPPATTTTACPPEPTNICKQPTNNRWGYSPEKPVAGIPLPIVTCNDIKDDFARNPFKLYNNADSRKCPSFSWPNRPNVCKEACEEQYEECKAAYVHGCDNRLGDEELELESRVPGDDGCATQDTRNEWGKKNSDVVKCWGTGANTVTASDQRCKAQYQDCLAINKNVKPGDVCREWCD
jgi:hypothetical protein